MSRVCPRCNKSRETVKVDRADPKDKGKYWRIEVCPTCSWNFDLEEVTRAVETRKDAEKRKRGGWFANG